MVKNIIKLTINDYEFVNYYAKKHNIPLGFGYINKLDLIISEYKKWKKKC
jgi:hypothetical protein